MCALSESGRFFVGLWAAQQWQCWSPELSTFVNYLYSYEAELFLPNSSEIVYSREGTTQGGPEPRYLCKSEKNTYADDGSAGGKLDPLLVWWQDLELNGPQFGYYPETYKDMVGC